MVGECVSRFVLFSHQFSFSLSYFSAQRVEAAAAAAAIPVEPAFVHPAQVVEPAETVDDPKKFAPSNANRCESDEVQNVNKFCWFSSPFASLG